MGTGEPPLPTPPAFPLEETGEDLRRLGEALKARAEEVLSRTVAQTAGPAYDDVDAVVQGSFERIGSSSTITVARWIAERAWRRLLRQAGEPGRSLPSWRPAAPRR
jgi:hypothetical protein